VILLDTTADALIAAQAVNREAALLTTDRDFGPLGPIAGLAVLR